MHPDGIAPGKWYAISRWHKKREVSIGGGLFSFGSERATLMVDNTELVGHPFFCEASSGVFAVGVFYTPGGKSRREILDLRMVELVEVSQRFGETVKSKKMAPKGEGEAATDFLTMNFIKATGGAIE